MSEHEQGSGDMSTGERMITLAGATADAIMHKGKGKHQTESGSRQTVDPATVEQVIADWPDAPQRGARQMLEQYGGPNDPNQTVLVPGRTLETDHHRHAGCGDPHLSRPAQ